ncbi:MAG: hypothetical protein FWD44_04415 [Oscillospiraceae bacterium]|nr:hypothetical protein [Oscillospiraceae bacterium]
MSLISNEKIINALKDYDFAEVTAPVQVSFSKEFDAKMDRFIRQKKRMRSVITTLKRSAVAVFAIAIVGSLFYLLMMQQNPDEPTPGLHQGSDTPPVDSMYFESGETKILFEFQQEKALLMQPLQVLPFYLEGDYDSFYATQTTSTDIRQGFYEPGDDQLPFDIISFIEIDGVLYSLGQVAYGDNAFLSSLREGYAYRFSPIGTLKLDTASAVIYAQHKSYGAKYDAVAYYIIEDGVPVLLTEIAGVVKYSFFDQSGVEAILSTDRALPYTQYTVSKFDLENQKLYYTNLTDLLMCDGVSYNEDDELYYTWHRPPASDSEEPVEGHTYTFVKGGDGNDTPDTPADETTDEIDISGSWVYTYSELDDGTIYTFFDEYEIWLELSSYYFEIHKIDTYDRHLIHTGSLHKTGDYSYTLFDTVAIIDGERAPSPLGDSTLEYDPATGLLNNFGLYYANEGYNQINIYYERK